MVSGVVIKQRTNQKKKDGRNVSSETPLGTERWIKKVMNILEINLSKAHKGTPQNIAARKGGTKPYTAINIYVNINTFLIGTQVYENKTFHLQDKTIDDKLVCVLQIAITKD